MARAIAMIAIMTIIVVAALTWCVIVHRDKVATREQRRLDHMQSTLREIDSLLFSYTPNDAMGDGLEKQAREILADYHTVLSVSAGRKRHLDAAQTARERLAALLAKYPQSLFAPSDDVSKTFVREVFSALYPAQPKEIPHVP
jgi:hypothetical protein